MTTEVYDGGLCVCGKWRYPRTVWVTMAHPVSTLAPGIIGVHLVCPECGKHGQIEIAMSSSVVASQRPPAKA